MGRRWRCSSSCKYLFCMFFGRSSSPTAYQREEEIEWEPKYMRKIRPSDEDRGRWVGEPDVDAKAAEYIARFRASREAIMV